MNLVPYTNTKPYNQHIGGRVIRPGETRMVDASLLPAAQPDETAPAAPAPSAMDELAKKSVSAIVDALPSLSAEELDALLAADAADGKARKGVTEAVAEEKLRRAAESQA